MSCGINTPEFSGLVYHFKTALPTVGAFKEDNFKCLKHEERVQWYNVLKEINKPVAEGANFNYFYCGTEEDQKQIQNGIEKGQALFAKVFEENSKQKISMKARAENTAKGGPKSDILCLQTLAVQSKLKDPTSLEDGWHIF